MEQTDILKRIEMPNENVNNEYVNYGKQMKPQLKFETGELKSLYQQHEAELLGMAEKKAWDYLVDFGAWDFGSNECFPCGQRMTGTWYVGSVYMDSKPLIGGYIEMRFTGYYQRPGIPNLIDDYLGMEFWFYYNSKTDKFEFDCFNIAVI